MKIYVRRPQKNEPGFESHPLRLMFIREDSIEEEFIRTESELEERLLNEQLYGGRFFPKDLLSVKEFIDKGFSIYF